MTQASENVMVLLYPRPEWHARHGRILADGRLVPLDIDLIRGTTLRLSVLLAYCVTAPQETFQPLLRQAEESRGPARLSYDQKDRTIRAEAYVAPISLGSTIPDEGTAEFEDFAALLNDRRLHMALDRCGGSLTGTPADLFENPAYDRD